MNLQPVDSSSTTIYEDVNRLTDMGLLERVTETILQELREILLDLEPEVDTEPDN
ncbi:hypothetical protein SAMN05421858_4679 [Haladaptatus litoreus]|uniref:Uncharacterized protein n=1 Tax=Haladaptatus litoreus TaxID=553468 RepID=A0A1N7F006_9EURY|nr:hypothetical protein SAMN05421858_4679 [Haladaptatus litoreus]